MQMLFGWKHRRAYSLKSSHATCYIESGRLQTSTGPTKVYHTLPFPYITYLESIYFLCAALLYSPWTTGFPVTSCREATPDEVKQFEVMDAYPSNIPNQGGEQPQSQSIFLGPAWLIACGVGAILGGFFMRGTSFSWPLMMLGGGVGLVGSAMLYRNVMVSLCDLVSHYGVTHISVS
ncbi:hypothetical protein Vafri_17755 [Volvox africanus]|uniref:Uncharacterized protein n=1 Tax=Volvox africanus TaxID=51714 RepID=A0A8J4FB22_9CHLO|nr:hypothetical protein Vafri_17755 [Volvox africanus]